MNRYHLAVFIILISVLGLASLSPIISVDLYWHLKTGYDFLFYGLSPFIDNYSLDFAGKRFTSSPYWLFQSLISILHYIFGKWGFVIYRLICWLVPLYITWLFLKKRKVSSVTFLLIAFSLVAVTTHRRLVRPELLSYVFSISICYFYLTYGLSRKIFFILAGILILWTNWHISSLFGQVLLGSFVLQELLESKNSKRRAELLAWGVTFFAIGFLNSTFSHSIIEVLSISQSGGVQEQDALPMFHLTPPYIYIVYLILLLFAAFSFFAQRKWAIGSMLLLLSIVPINTGKLIQHSTAASILFIVPALLEYEKKRFFKIAGSILTGAMAIGVFGYTFLGEKSFTVKIDKKDIPMDLTTYINKQSDFGPTFNDYGFGGYLLFYHFPKVRPFIDGRVNVLYPREYYNLVREANNDPVIFQKFFEERKFAKVIASLQFHKPLFNTVTQSGRLFVEYVGEQSLIFSTEGQFQELTKLLKDFSYVGQAPEAAVRNEIQKAKETWGPGLRHWLEFLEYFYEQGDLNALEEVGLRTKDVFVTRSLAQWNYAVGDWRAVIKLFGRQRGQLFYEDKLALIHALCESFNCEGANKLFLRLGRERKSKVAREKLKGLYIQIVGSRGFVSFSAGEHRRIKRFLGIP